MNGRRNHVWRCILLTGLVLSGCARIPLGDGSLRGRLPDGWNDSFRADSAVVMRITKPWVPVSFEIELTEIAEKELSRLDIKTQVQDQWVFVRETTVPGPTVRVGSDWKKTTREVWTYVRRFPDGRLLWASVDRRFKKEEAERFLGSLKPAPIVPSL